VYEKRPNGTYYPHFAGIEIRNGEFPYLGAPELGDQNLTNFVSEAGRFTRGEARARNGGLRELFGLRNSGVLGVLLGGFILEGEFGFGDELVGDVLEGEF